MSLDAKTHQLSLTKYNPSREITERKREKQQGRYVYGNVVGVFSPLCKPSCHISFFLSLSLTLLPFCCFSSCSEMGQISHMKYRQTPTWRTITIDARAHAHKISQARNQKNTSRAHVDSQVSFIFFSLKKKHWLTKLTPFFYYGMSIMQDGYIIKKMNVCVWEL